MTVVVEVWVLLALPVDEPPPLVLLFAVASPLVELWLLSLVTVASGELVTLLLWLLLNVSVLLDP